MTDFSMALEHLGLSDQDWGSDYRSSYSNLKNNWRGETPLPSESEVMAAVQITALKDIKISAIDKNRKEAGIRIADLFEAEYGSNKLRDKQLNDFARYSELREKEVAATITAPEIVEIAALRAKQTSIKAIRAAENAAAAAINNAANKAAVDAISVSWP